MNKKQLLPCGCGGEAIVGSWWRYSVGKRVCAVSCAKCGIQIKPCDTESEAISVWNKAMSGNVQDCAKDAQYTERTAKVIMHKYWLGVSLNIVGEQTIGHEWICENCKKIIFEGDDYCSHCGSKLIWNEGISMEYFESWGR